LTASGIVYHLSTSSGEWVPVHWIDVAIVIVLAAGIIVGAMRGLIVEVGSIVGAVLGVVVAEHTYRGALTVLSLLFPRDAHLATVAYLVIFFIVWALVTTLAQVVRAAVRFTPFGLLDRLGGAVIGLVVAILAVEVLLLLASASHDASLHASIKHSRLAPAFERAIPGLRHAIPKRLLKI
jgi:membrane protein required for colicin V production